MLQTVIFDGDEVLYNASHIHFQALNRALASKGWMITQAEHRAHYNGLPTQKKLNLLTEKKGLPAEWHQDILEIKTQLTQEVISEFLNIDISKKELFAALRGHGLSVAVASNMHQSSLELMLAQLGLAQYCDAVIGNDKVGLSRVKPHPDVYLNAALAVGSDISVSALVVNEESGIETARSADPLDIVGVSDHLDVNLQLLPRILKFWPDELAA